MKFDVIVLQYVQRAFLLKRHSAVAQYWTLLENNPTQGLEFEGRIYQCTQNDIRYAGRVLTHSSGTYGHPASGLVTLCPLLAGRCSALTIFPSNISTTTSFAIILAMIPPTEMSNLQSHLPDGDADPHHLQHINHHQPLTNAAQINILLPIFAHLSLPSILALMATSTSVKADLQACVRFAFHQLLKRFSVDPQEFRDLMRTHGTITFGDDALQFMRRGQPGVTDSCRPGRLSLLVPGAVAEDGFVRILRAAGYTEEARTVTTDEFLPLGLMFIRNWCRVDEDDGSTARVRLFVTFPGPQFIQVLPHLSTSAHLSYITADSIHVFLPTLTLAGRAVVMARGFTEDEDEGLSLERLTLWRQDEIHYLQDYYHIEVRTLFDWDGEPCGAACGIAMHSFKSRNVLRLTFDPDGVAASPWYASGDGFQGRNIHFQLRGRCYNKHCPNYLDLSYAALFVLLTLKRFS